MAWSDGITPFGEKLYALIARKGWSVREFATKAGTYQSNLSDIRRRKRSPPLHHVEAWADLLSVTGREREYFLDLAALECAPARVLAMFNPNHPAYEAIRVAIENDVSASRVADVGLSYEAKPRRSKRRTQQ